MKTTIRKHLADIFFILVQELAPRCRYPCYKLTDDCTVVRVEVETQEKGNIGNKPGF